MLTSLEVGDREVEDVATGLTGDADVVPIASLDVARAVPLVEADAVEEAVVGAVFFIPPAAALGLLPLGFF